MKPKIIVADDSQTIQKVIKITLASEDYELIECTDANNLLEIVEEHKPAVTLLDFNLSENKTGYDLANDIKSVNDCRVMMLYGTFDSIDENLLDAAGVNNHIVKPFDGNKFITYCREMVEEYSQLESDEVTPSIEDEFVQADIEVEDDQEEVPTEEGTESIDSEMTVEIDDDWVVEQPEVIEEQTEETNEDVVETSNPVATENIVTKEELNQLEAGMLDWGIDVPGVIGQESFKANSIELPPVIGGDGTEIANITMESPVKDMAIDNNSEEREEISSKTLETDIVAEKIAKAKESAQQLNNQEDLVEDKTEEPIEDVSEGTPLELESSEDVVTEENEPTSSGLEIEIDQTEITQPIDIDKILNSENSENQAAEDENVLPAAEDLEYPDMGSISIETSQEPEILNKLTPLDEMNFSDDSLPETSGIDLNSTLGSDTEEEINKIKEQIADDYSANEVEEDHNNLWKSDSEINKASHDEGINSEISIQKEIVIDEEVIEQKVQEKLTAMLEPLVERLVQDKVNQIVEKVSWEVIPDLAENLIKKELQGITREIMGEQ